jgi:hypothetical protein
MRASEPFWFRCIVLHLVVALGLITFRGADVVEALERVADKGIPGNESISATTSQRMQKRIKDTCVRTSRRSTNRGSRPMFETSAVAAGLSRAAERE